MIRRDIDTIRLYRKNTYKTIRQPVPGQWSSSAADSWPGGVGGGCTRFYNRSLSLSGSMTTARARTVGPARSPAGYLAHDLDHGGVDPHSPNRCGSSYGDRRLVPGLVLRRHRGPAIATGLDPRTSRRVVYSLAGLADSVDPGQPHRGVIDVIIIIVAIHNN